MSESLRARIDRIISEVSGGQSSHQEHAQAIIDEFGLEEEVSPNKYLPDESRVVGKWEKRVR